MQRALFILLTFLCFKVNASPGDTTYLKYSQVVKQSNHHAYHQTLVLKLFMSQALYDGQFKRRDNGRSDLFLDAEQALEVIRKIDRLTLGIPKIIYLVGWQYNGHDSGYPAWFGANNLIKRKQDANALESLRWLMKEAKSFHTTVSLHINMFDAYEDSPLWNDYVKADIIARRKDGSLLGGEWGYPISYAQEWKMGYAQKRIDSLCAILPVQDAATIHIDAFHTWPPIPVQKPDGSWTVNLEKKPTSPYLAFTVEDETAAQRKIYGYWASKGIDVTSEGVDFLRLDAFADYQSMAWWVSGPDLYLKWPAAVYSGGVDRSDWGKLFGTSMHGEAIIKKDPVNLSGFTRDFCLNTLVWYFLNRLDRKYIVETPVKKEVHFSRDVQTELADGRFTLQQGKAVLAEQQDVLVPAAWIDDHSLLAYSGTGYGERTWTLPQGYGRFKKAILSRVTANGLVPQKTLPVRSGKLKLAMQPDEMCYISLR